MFIFHAAFALGLIALVSGAYLFCFASSREYESGFGKFIGIIVIVFAFIGLICTAYYGVKYWQQGYLDKPMMMHSMNMMHGSMSGSNAMHSSDIMKNCMMNCRNMQGGAMESSVEQNSNQSNQTNVQEHSAHHAR